MQKKANEIAEYGPKDNHGKPKAHPRRQKLARQNRKGGRPHDNVAHEKNNRGLAQGAADRQKVTARCDTDKGHVLTSGRFLPYLRTNEAMGVFHDRCH